MRFFIFFILLTLNLFPQNRDTYLAFLVNDGLYQYFDSLGVKDLENIDSCDCETNYYCNIWFFVKKSEDNDTIILNDVDNDELIFSVIEDYKKKFSKYHKFPESIKLETDVIRKSSRFNIIYWKRKVKYKIVVKIFYKPKTL